MKQLKVVLRSLFMCLVLSGMAISASSQWNPDHSIGAVSGNYNYSYNQTPDQLVEIYPPLYTTGTVLSYQWEQSSAPDFTAITVLGTQSSYTFSGPLAQATYFRR